MVATIAAGTSAGYYLAQSEYYLGGSEPPGSWIAAGADFCIVNGATVERELFERLHAATDGDGKTLLSNGGNRIDRVPGYDMTFSAPIGERDISFFPADLADENGRDRLAHAHASTIYGAQGLTAEQAFVLRDPACDRHDAYVGLSRARDRTEIFADRRLIDAGIRAEQPLSKRATMAEPDDAARTAWLADRLSRSRVKGTTLDLLLPQLDDARRPLDRRQHEAGFGYEIEPA